MHPGVRTDRILTAGLSLPDARYAKREQIAAFHRQLVDGLRTLPGVRSAGLVSCLPVDGWCGDNTFHIEGRPLPPGQFLDSINRAIWIGYGLQKRDKNIYLPCIGWIVLDGAKLVGVFAYRQ